jgi:hypothetical protein
MNDCKLDDKNFEQLIFAIRRKRCILMLGPDASAEEVSGELQPLNNILANELAQEIRADIKKDISPSHLTEVSQYYQMENGRFGLESFVESFYEKRQHAVSKIHQNLAGIPFYFTVTASPDKLFANALTENGKPPQISVYNFKGSKSDTDPVTGTEENPLLFYLYGSADEPESLVITENDLLDFLISVISKAPGLPPSITSELYAEDKNFLFLGFGFKHWYLRMLLHVLAGNSHKQSRSFALELMPENPNEYKRAILFFKNHNTCKIHIFHDELTEFTEKLKREFDRSVSCVPAVPEQDKPSVFICHAKADEPHAEWLYQEFTQAGFDPFLDKESIPPGADWNPLIEKTIKEIDFFIILKTKALAERAEGYVNKEINLALEKQQYFTPTSPFIIPVKIEVCKLEWDELERWQDADLTDKANISKLIKAIRRHYEKRRKRGQ